MGFNEGESNMKLSMKKVGMGTQRGRRELCWDCDTRWSTSLFRFEAVLVLSVCAQTWMMVGFRSEDQILRSHQYREQAGLFFSDKGEGEDRRKLMELRWSESICRLVDNGGSDYCVDLTMKDTSVVAYRI